MRSEVLQHPNGTSVVLLGTQHVSATHGCLAREQIEAGTPTAVVLELDQVCRDLQRTHALLLTASQHLLYPAA
jgi:pheromone shutdown protein TraB